LRQKGIQATQSSVSRDLAALGVLRVNGRYEVFTVGGLGDMKLLNTMRMVQFAQASGPHLTVITTVINTARAGGQSRITVVGHTDTSGSADYNQKLSERRANVVVEALVDMGARRAAIQASGVGETDLAIQTPDNTKEARNRRSVVSLAP